MAAYACKKVSDALPEINAFKAQQALSRHINGGLLALCQNDIADKQALVLTFVRLHINKQHF